MKYERMTFSLSHFDGHGNLFQNEFWEALPKTQPKWCILPTDLKKFVKISVED